MKAERKLLWSYAVILIIFLLNNLATLLLLEQKLALLLTQWGLFSIVCITLVFVVKWYKRENIKFQQYKLMNSTLTAIYRSQPIIEFNMDGTILTANKRFLDVLGYSLDELVGQHHRILVDPEYRDSAEYKAFWEKLNRGQYDQGEYKRIKKDGTPIWLLSSYNPIFNEEGKPVKIIKVATDITERKKQEEQIKQLTATEQVTAAQLAISKQIVRDINSITTGIDQLKSTAASQASSATEQAASITEIGTTIEEIKTTAKQTLEKAKLLGESANRTNKESEKGKNAIEKMNDSMQMLQNKMNQISSTILGLNDKTQQISEITATVSDIASQSKMLALNASIEAAKAGESGKGFAVVAGEVKELAEKSQSSTELVQKILMDIRQTAEHAVMVTEDGTKSVEQNNQQVKMTGDIINALAEVIESTAMSALQIVSAIREETVAIEQIDMSMKEVSKVTSMFTTAAEQTNTAILNLGNVCNSLNKTANSYKE